VAPAALYYGMVPTASKATTGGRIYITAYEHDAILRRLPDVSLETVVHDPRLLWPDTRCRWRWTEICT
jgi:hypothetical protein